jgi:hypothetical protein
MVLASDSYRQAKRGTGCLKQGAEKLLDQPTAILTNKLDNGQHFFTRQVNYSFY